MGKCKICGTGIEDTEEMCNDCKALDDVDLIKSDDELEELLNSVMHSHTSYRIMMAIISHHWLR